MSCKPTPGDVSFINVPFLFFKCISNVTVEQTSIRSASAFVSLGSLSCACIAEVAKLFADRSFAELESQCRSFIFLTRAEQSDETMSASR